MRYFVASDSVVRRIWGDADAVLLVFAGSAAEFALNRAVDWLFITGALPADPVGRIFRTAHFAQEIVFADRTAAEQTLERIRSIHGTVERARGQRIPDWAYRDVLYMLIAYSECAHALLDRPLTAAERADLYDVFWRVGTALGIPALPASYAEWRRDRQRHLERDLTFSRYTAALYAAYRRQLGPWRYVLLLQLQSALAPREVLMLLQMHAADWVRPAISAYRWLARAGLRPRVRQLLLPGRYIGQVHQLDVPTGFPLI